jgi:hypothetical protein
MSAPTGTAISFTAPTCGAKGTWFDYTATGGTVGNPPIAPANPSPTMTFSPLPASLPAEAGTPATSDASVPEGGISGPKAACISGATGTTPYSTEGMGLNFGTSPSPDGGNGIPVLIDASSHAGIQFWTWGGADAGTQTVIVALGDKNETPGLGVSGQPTGTGTFCDPTVNGPTSCGAATHNVTIGPGWNLVTIPFTAFADNMYYGGMNEAALDPTSLTQLQFQVQLTSPDGGAPVPFNFCVYNISFN